MTKKMAQVALSSSAVVVIVIILIYLLIIPSVQKTVINTGITLDNNQQPAILYVVAQNIEKPRLSLFEARITSGQYYLRLNFNNPQDMQNSFYVDFRNVGIGYITYTLPEQNKLSGNWTINAVLYVYNPQNNQFAIVSQKEGYYNG